MQLSVACNLIPDGMQLMRVALLPICDFFTQHVISLWRDTTSELWTPVLFSLLLNQSPQKLCLLSCNLLFCYFSATILHPLDMFNPLCSAKPVSLTTSPNSWGKVICCLCAGFHVALTMVEAPCHFPIQKSCVSCLLKTLYMRHGGTPLRTWLKHMYVVIIYGNPS